MDREAALSLKTRPQEAIKIPTAAELEKNLFDAGIARKEFFVDRDITVVDVAACTKFLQQKYGSGGGRKEVLTQRLLKSFSTMFPEGVVSEEQITLQDYQTVPLFYFPTSVAGATSTSTIKSARFHLRIGDVLTRYRMRTALPLQESDHITAYESEAALAIFHPKIGNGYRDENNVLMVQDTASGEYIPFSASFLTKAGVNKKYLVIPEGESLHTARANVRRSMREGAPVEFPHLVAKNVLIPERDFRQISLGNERVNERRSERMGVSSGGVRMINGVLHYIGKEFYKRPVRVTEISPSLGCVIDESKNEPRISHLFRLFQRDELVATEKGWYLAGKNLVQTREFNADSFALPQLPNETPLMYQERKETIDRGIAFLLLSVAKDHPEVSSLFSVERMSVLGEVARCAYWLSKETEQEKLSSFVDEYGAEGLQTFLVTAVSSSAVHDILSFSEESNPDSVRNVFSVFSQYVDHIASIERELMDRFSSRDKKFTSVITEKLLERGRVLLNQAYVMRNEPEKITELIAGLDVEVRVYSDICKQLAREDQLSLQTLKDVEVLMVPGGGLKGSLQRAVRDVQHELYKDRYTELLPVLDSKLQEALADPNARVHLAVHKGMGAGETLVTSAIFRDSPGTNETHIQTVLLNPKFEGSSLGGANFTSALSVEWERKSTPEQRFTLECDPSPQLLQFYGKNGFVFAKYGLDTDEPTVYAEKSERMERLQTAMLSLKELQDRCKTVTPSGDFVYITGSVPERGHVEFQSIMDGEDGKGARALTRYEVKNGTFYAAFERLSSGI